MKNLFDILKEKGVELPEGFDKESFEKEFHSNYKTVAELEKKDSRITELEGQLTEVNKSLEGFKGVNIDDLNGKISTLTQSLADREAEYAAKVADMDFGYRLDGAIGKAKGKNAKAIKALLDVTALKESKNQDVDIQGAIDALKEENGYLFEDEQVPPPYAGGTGSGRSNGSKLSVSELDFLKGAGLTEEDLQGE